VVGVVGCVGVFFSRALPFHSNWRVSVPTCTPHSSKHGKN
jgi:hypothetical protein